MQLGKIHRNFSRVVYKDLDMYSVLYHPRYFEFTDTARNQAFQDFGYPIEEQMQDKVGFTVASIENAAFMRPLFMGETISVFTEVVSVSTKSCVVWHWINLGNDESDILTTEDKFSEAVFKAQFRFVFVDISDISEFPLSAQNINGMKAIPFNEKVKSRLKF